MKNINCTWGRMRGMIKSKLKDVVKSFLTTAVLRNNIARGEDQLKSELVRIVPDISRQYTTFEIASDDKFLNENVRCLHAFQIGLALKAVDMLRPTQFPDSLKIVDIGDSSGTHLQYLNAILKDRKIEVNTFSVNLDPIAVGKIKEKGLNAIQCRAEELSNIEGGVRADIFLLYETLEHLFDPISFLHSMSEKTDCKYFVITVPYILQSRVGMQHVRLDTNKAVFAENTHIFELSVEDWNLIFKFSGWKIVHSDIYTQYPRIGILNLAKYILRYLSFEGFYGVILERDDLISSRYQSW